MKKRKIITKSVEERLFDADIVLVICHWDDFLPAAKKILAERYWEQFEKMVIDDGHGDSSEATQYPVGEGGGSVIWANPDVEKGALVHEIVHAAHHLLKCRATPLSKDTEETYAYLIQFLFNNLVK